MRIKKGFTLIELLMCVLIIGVLTAIAVPKYTKVLERSRVTEAMSMVKSINDAVYAYAAGRPNGSCPTSFRQLSITLPTTADNENTISLKNFRYELGAATNAVVPGTNCAGTTATRINGGDAYDYVIWNPFRVRTEGSRSRLGCYSPSENSKSIELCESLGLYDVENETPAATHESNGGPIIDPGIDPGFERPFVPRAVDVILDSTLSKERAKSM